MIPPPPLPDETARLEALRGLSILDTPPEPRFDRITRLAAAIFGVPVALVSLVDAGRQWFKSRIGLDASETSRDISFCGHAIATPDILVVEDADRDRRFVDNPLVTGEPRIRFYAGCPLTAANGQRLGTLCIIDRRPRTLDAGQRAALRDLAAIAENELNAIELNSALRRQRESELRIRALVDNVTDGIVMLDGAGTIEAFNLAAEGMFGRDANEVLGRPVGELVVGPMPELGKCEPTQNPVVRAAETTGKRSDGSEFPIEYSVSVMHLAGQIKYNVVLRDIAKRKAAEARLQELDQLRRKFFAMAAHELRAPLASVHGFAELLVQREFNEADRRDLLDRVYRQSRHLLDLVNNMLDLVRIEAGKGEDFDLRPERVENIIERAASRLDGLGARRRIRMHIPADLPPLVCDPDKLQQAVVNILSNSLKYSDDVSEIGISASVEEDGRQMVIRVTDRGIGMTPEQLARVCERFYRADPGGSIAGTGLGMSIVKEIVEMHGGILRISSEPGRGTTVGVSVPIAGRGNGGASGWKPNTV